MYYLHIQPAVGEPFDHVMKEGSLVIGRASESDLVVADRFLSRKHARLLCREGRIFVEDLGSRNGTLLNDRRVDGTVEVHPGDLLKVSGSVIRVSADKPTPSDVSQVDSASLPGMTVVKQASHVLESASSDTGEIRGEDNLRKFAARLQLLNEVHGALSRSIQLEELLELILERAFEHLRPEEGAIFLKDEDHDDYRLAARRTVGGTSDYLYSRTLVSEVADKRLAVVVLDAQTDERFAEAQSIMASGVRSLVAAPLLDPEGCLGIIVLSSRVQMRQFSESDVDLLVSLASVAALRIRNVALAEEAAERRELARELELARRIQVALLPDALPEIPGYDLHGGNIPSRGVSGDFYEIVGRRRADDGVEEYLTLVADVSGKGMSASLLAAALEALTASPIEVGMRPEEVVHRASRLLYERTPPERYATAILVALEPESGDLSFVNAGHVPGLLIRGSGEIEQLEATGQPIGLLPASAYSAGSTRLAKGDLLVLYTDGINEAENPSGEQYGVERLAAACRAKLGLRLNDLAAAIEMDLSDFAGPVPFADDRTTVLIRRQPS